METTLIAPQAVRELLFEFGWTYHPKHRVFTQFPDLELSPTFWELDRRLPSDDCTFDRLARQIGIPRDTLIEDLVKRTQRLLEEIPDSPPDPKSNSEEPFYREFLKKAQIAEGPEEPKPCPISPEAVREFLLENGWKYNEKTGVFRLRENELGPMCRDIDHPIPSDCDHFDFLSRHTGISRESLIEDLVKRTQRLLEEILDSPPAPKSNSEQLFAREVFSTSEEPFFHVPVSHVETVVSALRIGIEYGRIALKNRDTKSLSSSRLEKHVTSLIEEDIREMERALELLEFNK